MAFDHRKIAAVDEFKLQNLQGEWVVTIDHKLIQIDDGGNEIDLDRILDSFFLILQAPHHTTDWLRLFCKEHHPEIDFDEEFDTSSPGVFARYNEKFGFDYTDRISDAQYNALRKELNKRGYEIDWEMNQHSCGAGS